MSVKHQKLTNSQIHSSTNSDNFEIEESNISTTEDQYNTVLDQNNIFLFAQEFTYESSSSAIKFILAKNLLPAAERPEYLTMIIMSEGGLLSAAFGLVDIMLSSQIPIHTIGIGHVASAAMMILMAGQNGYRKVTTNTSLLSHQFSWSMEGKAHELEAANKEIKLTEQRMINLCRRCTNLTKKTDVQKYLLPPTDVWLTPQQAIELGLIDAIEDSLIF